MRSQSVQTNNPDPYEAGCEIGEALAPIQPEAVFLFSSVHYEEFEDFFQGFNDTIANTDVITIGATGDGFYETTGIGTIGASALGINSGGKVRWHGHVITEVQGDSKGATSRCATIVQEKAAGDTRLAFVVADGLTCDGVAVVEGVEEIMNAPVVGGTAGDDRKFERGYIFYRGKAYRDSIALLSLSGDFQFATHAASGWKPCGDAGTVEEASQNRVSRISGMTPMQFMEQNMGRLPSEVELGVFPLAAYDDSGNFHLRAAVGLDHETNELTFAGSIKKGALVRVCHAAVDDILSGVNDVVGGLENLPFSPSAAVVVSCAARKWVLGDKLREEVERLTELVGKDLPLAGFPSFGEISPFRLSDDTYSKSVFHNETVVVLFLGD